MEYNYSTSVFQKDHLNEASKGPSYSLLRIYKDLVLCNFKDEGWCPYCVFEFPLKFTVAILFSMLLRA